MLKYNIVPDTSINDSTQNKMSEMLTAKKPGLATRRNTRNRSNKSPHPAPSRTIPKNT